MVLGVGACAMTGQRAALRCDLFEILKVGALTMQLPLWLDPCRVTRSGQAGGVSWEL